MKYKKLEMYSYNIHMIQTDKFKSVLVRVNFKKELEKADITNRQMLIKVMMESTGSYPTKQQLASHCEDLYQTNMRASNTISGNVVITSFSERFLNEQYTEKGLNQECLHFLFDTILNPKVENNQFSMETYKIMESQIKENIAKSKSEPSSYSNMRLLEIMDPKGKNAYHLSGDLEELEKLNPSKLYEYYQNMLRGDIVDVFIVGDIDFDKAADQIKSEFLINTVKRKKPQNYITYDKFRSRPKTVVEPFSSQQSKLAIGFKLDTLTEFERRYVILIYNQILGGGLDSKLFEEVREKNSLCYTIHSSPATVSGLYFIRAGINGKDFKKAVKLIRNCIKEMAKGDFTQEKIDNAIQSYVISYQQLLDSENSILEDYVKHEYLNTDIITEKMENIKKVTKEMIVKVAPKIHMDTIYLLEGEVQK